MCREVGHARLYDLPHLYKVRTLKKTQSVLVDPSHHLSKMFKKLPSGRIQYINMQDRLCKLGCCLFCVFVVRFLLIQGKNL